MYDLRRLQHLANGARLGALLALGLAHLQVSAQGAGPLEMPQRLDRFHIWVNGNIVTNKYASEAEEYGIRMAQHARVYGTTHPDVGGGVQLSKQLAINTKNGVVVAEAVQKIGPRAIARGLMAVANGPLGTALLAATVVAQLLDAAKLQFDGSTWKAPDPAACTSNCWSFDSLHDSQSIWFTSASWYVGKTVYNCVISSAWLNSANSNGASFGYSGLSAYGTGQSCSGSVNAATQARAPDPVSYVPITQQQAEDKLTAANPGPAVLKELADKGGHAPNPDPTDKPKIQNPQPSQEKVTTKTNPDGSSETTSCRTNGTSTADGSVKLTESCTITKKDAQGNPTGTTTTTSDDADPVAKPDDSLLCSVFPKIAACAELDTPEGEIPTASETIGYTAENHFGGGSCPADKTMTLATTGQAMTVWNWSQACNAITDYFRPLFITLCTLTALFILAPGVKEGA